MKRFIALFIAASVFFTALPVFAADKAETDYEGIITTVRDAFDLPEDLSNVQISQYAGHTYISWSYDNGGREYNIGTDEHGCVTSYYSYDNRDQSESKSMGLNEKIGKVRAQKIAEKVLTGLYGEAAASLVCENTRISSSAVSFTYYYTQNGIKLDEPVIISVNRLTGDISNFSGICFETLKYEYKAPDNAKLINTAKELETYKQNKHFKLVYQSFHDITGKRFVKPVYIIEPAYVNAEDGSLVAAEDNFYDNGLGFAEETAAYADDSLNGATQSKRVTQYEKKAIEDYKNLISEEKADSIIKKYFPVIKDAEIEDSYTYWMDDTALIDISYGTTETSMLGYAGAELNAKTGEVLYFYSYMPKQDDKDFKYDTKKAADIADKLIKQLAPDIYSGGEYTVETENGNVYYKRVYNGIEVNGQSVSIGVDSDYNISTYQKNWYDIDFPSLDDVIDETAVFNTCLEANDHSLRYIIKNNKPMLVYGMDSSNLYGSFYYDAKTGKRISSYDGEPYEDTANGKYTDLENSPYKETIETLSEYGYRLPYSKFEPDKPITVEDFCTFFSYPAEFITYADKPVYTESQLRKDATKYDVATVFVEAMGYTELAQKDIFVDKFDDVDEKYKGTVAIASAMGLIFERQGKYNGTETVTRGQAAEYIYNFLASNNML